MTDVYTHVSKPSGTTYNIVGFQGRQTYDDPSVRYDDPNVLYDSVNNNAYTIVAKPTDGFTITSGMATGLLIPFTYPNDILAGSGYTIIPKPTT